jgi:phosphatidylserine/phosphatidylglycerophosphate/cardiolipin synthase-like enzyme
MFFKKKVPARRPPPPPLPKKTVPKRPRWPFVVWSLAAIGGSLWLAIASLAPNQPRSDEPPRLYSNQTQQDLRLTLVEAIKKATQSIHLVMFGLSDPAILHALATKKIPSIVYYDPNGSPKLFNTLPNADLHPVRGFGLMHQKILVVDQETVFIGSANMTTASLTMHDNLVVGLKSKKIAQFLIEHTPNLPGYLRTMVGGQQIELWLLPDPRGHALQDLRKKIRAAHDSLKIALFTFTHPSLVDEVIGAHKRGVQVTLVIDMQSGLGASNQAIERLKSSGIRVLMSQGVQLLHHKFILIDNQTLLTGSANWTKAAFYKNSDCFLCLHHLTDEQKRFMSKLWSRIESEARLLR